MERLGSLDLKNFDIAEELKKANKVANEEAEKVAKDVGQVAAGAVDAVLKDVAQKFEAFGKEASVYFEGRARLLSVLVAVALAFAINIDAVELFKTFLRDPQVRTAMIKQADAVFNQQKDTEKRLEELRAKKDAADYEEIKKQYLQEAERTKKVVAELAEIGVPIGWDKAKITLIPLQSYPICIKTDAGKMAGKAVPVGAACDAGETAGTAWTRGRR